MIAGIGELVVVVRRRAVQVACIQHPTGQRHDRLDVSFWSVKNQPTDLAITPSMRSFQRASAWLAAFVIGLPGLGLVAVIVALRGRSWVMFSVPYLVLFMLAYLVGLVLLVLLRFRPDWLRALVAAVVMYVIASVTPLVGTMIHYPYHVVRCGGLPVVATGFAAAMSYNVPGDESYAVTPFDETFFCGEKEAKAAGYHRYDF